MTALLLDPHGDDLALFCAFAALRHPHEIGEYPSVLVTHPTVPLDEISAGHHVLGMRAEIILEGFWDTALRSVMYREAEPVFAPAVEESGHADHCAVGQLALDVFGPERVTPYLTYAPRGHRSTWGTEVIPTAKEIALKFRALSCFESQIEQPSTRPWFFDLLDLREWVA